jgi:hypothetical protein
MAAVWAWLYANCAGNLVASAIWGAPAGIGFVWHHRAIKRHHSAEIRRLHAHLDAIKDSREEAS